MLLGDLHMSSQAHPSWPGDLQEEGKGEDPLGEEEEEDSSGPRKDGRRIPTLRGDLHPASGRRIPTLRGDLPEASDLVQKFKEKKSKEPQTK